MSNAWWYGAITVLFLAAGFYISWRVRDRSLLALYAFLSGLTYVAEYVVLVLLNAYRYRPAVMRDPYFDSLVGAIVSDAVTIPIAGVLVAAFHLNWGWMIPLSVLVVGIEVLFVYLHIYEHNWWNYLFTGAGLLVWFVVAKAVYKHLQTKLTLPLRWLTLFFTNTLLQASTVFVLVAFFGTYQYEIGWFRERVRDHVAFATAIVLVLSFAFSSLVALRVRWPWRIAAILLLTPVDQAMVESGVLHLSSRWSLMHFVIMRIMLIATLELFNRFVLDRSRASEPTPLGSKTRG